MTVHFVGAGPGAADLITLRAAALLAAADVVLYPGTYLDAEVLTHCPDARQVDTQRLDLDQITAVDRALVAQAASVLLCATGAAAGEVVRRLDVPAERVEVVPDSGTGDLTGLAGSMTITIEGGKHSYELLYTLP